MEDFMNDIGTRLDRIEEKINYMLSLIEELFAENNDEEDEEEHLEDDSGNEGWIPGLDFWKNEEE